MKRYPFSAKLRVHRKGFRLALHANSLKAIHLKLGTYVYLKQKHDELILFIETARPNRLIGAPKNWDSFFEAVSRLKDLDGFLSASERGQLIQESEDNR